MFIHIHAVVILGFTLRAFAFENRKRVIYNTKYSENSAMYRYSEMLDYFRASYYAGKST